MKIQFIQLVHIYVCKDDTCKEREEKKTFEIFYYVVENNFSFKKYSRNKKMHCIVYNMHLLYLLLVLILFIFCVCVVQYMCLSCSIDLVSICMCE